MSKAKELFDEGIISNIYKSMMLFKEDTDIIKEELDYAEKCHNLEEQLGCPLEVVFKALKDGIWYEDVANRMTHIGVGLDTANYDCEYLLREYDNTIRFLPRNYKKTWWLKKDKSE